MPRKFTAADGLIPGDLVHCGLDHLTAARLLFRSEPGHFDAAGYLTHIGVELLLKGWLLDSVGSFRDSHNLEALYDRLESECGATPLTEKHKELLAVLNQYAELRYPNRRKPTEIGDGNWPEIEALVGHLCRSMPKTLEQALEGIDPTKKA